MMTDQKTEELLDKVRHRMLQLKQRNFFGTLTIEVDYKDGGISDKYIGDREKIL